MGNFAGIIITGSVCSSVFASLLNHLKEVALGTKKTILVDNAKHITARCLERSQKLRSEALVLASLLPGNEAG